MKEIPWDWSGSRHSGLGLDYVLPLAPDKDWSTSSLLGVVLVGVVM